MAKNPYALDAVLDTLKTNVRGLAETLGTSTQALYRYKKSGKQLSAELRMKLREKFPKKFPEPRA